MPKARRAGAMKVVAQEEWQRCADDILYWLDPDRHLMPYVYTKDPHPMHVCNHCSDGEAYGFDKRHIHLLNRHKIEASTEGELRVNFHELDTIRVFTMKPYFQPIIEAWLREPFLAVEKSRDMMATWLVVVMYTWDTCFHKGRQNIFQSEDATKSRDLVDRAFTAYNNQPKWLRDLHKATVAEGGNRSGILKVPSLQSELFGFPAGADKIRQFHPTGVFSDEAAFNPEAGETFAAIKPAVQNGGRYTAISSANAGWFFRVCRDVI